MSGNLFLILIVSFVGLLFLNIYIRLRVLKLYRRLVKNRVQFETNDLLNVKRMETEVIPKYPEHEDTIRQFVRQIKFSIRIAIVLVVLISIFGALLMLYR